MLIDYYSNGAKDFHFEGNGPDIKLWNRAKEIVPDKI